jgi:hypothetical protein
LKNSLEIVSSPSHTDKVNRLVVPYNNKKSDRGDELIAFKRRVVEIVFAEDTLSGAKTYDESQSGS